MRIVFAGTPPVAVPTLDALTESRHDVVGVVTRADAPLGRKRELTPSPVAARAAELALPTIKANRLRDAETDAVAALEPDLGVIVAYGGLLRAPMLAAPRLGWINLHFSLLPRWRGAAPVQRAVMAGDSETGSAVFQLVEELDAGDVFSLERRPIGGDETSGDVLEALSVSGAAQLASVVDQIADGRAVATAQTGTPTLAAKLTLDDARLVLTDAGDEVYARLRGVTPEPGAFVLVGGERFKIHAARLARGAERLAPGGFGARAGRVYLGTATHPLELLTVQPAGKKAMAAADWWRGQKLTEGLVAE
ncbi:methionyl-tRNA formyltransferase [Gryllotalpicola protaetiae]|uniref:Methionyl-tRNA formyltransferase n=1 Tax=Gryllotalpicola protaetiae TaxID=2419771 RepID=A0A387BSC7_9MICO|nr:methionyl-tRNA formyltransferase [Gryllotalpicola protaetiae]AYG05492.1 methionyl-tRNA formyltransferase [Gryllotalpicola protaetiae]